MPIIKSAQKRMRTTERQGIENSKTKRSLKARVKAFQAAVTGNKNVESAQNELYSAIDTAVKKGVISKNKAARQKSRLNALSKAASDGKRASAPAKKKPATASKPVAAKKPAAKKPAAKKPAAKKAPAKKK